jgi:hypothetical protein
MPLITPKPTNVLEHWTFTHCIICVECSFVFRIHLEVGALDKNVRKGGLNLSELLSMDISKLPS